MQNIQTIFAVHQGDDDRHAGEPCWFFESKAAAIQCAERRGWYGGNAPISEHAAIIVDGNAYLLKRREPIKLNESPEDHLAKVAAVRAKLTKEELELLGI
jgi:hypothetical protein